MKKLLARVIIAMLLLGAPAAALADTCSSAQNINTIERLTDTVETQTGRYATNPTIYCTDYRSITLTVIANCPPGSVITIREGNPAAKYFVQSPIRNIFGWGLTEVVTRGVTDVVFKHARKTCGTIWYGIDLGYTPVLIHNAQNNVAIYKYRVANPNQLHVGLNARF